MRKTLLFITVILFCPAFACASGSTWQYLSTDEDGVSRFYDSGNIEYADHTAKVLQKETYRESLLYRLRERLGEKFGDFTEIVRLIEIDCPNKRSRVGSVIYYDSKGAAIKKLSYGNLKWNAIRRNSVEDLVYELGCPADWVYAVSSDDCDYFLNVAMMDLNDSDVTFWIKEVDKKTSKETAVTMFTARCGKKDYAVRYHAGFKPDGGVSNLQPYTTYLQWHSISTGTVIDSFQKLLCTDAVHRQDIKGILKKRPQSGAGQQPASAK